jgi:tetratricopeptide (TPR) repeat protein
MPDPAPPAPFPSALQPAPSRRLALLGVGMGVMVVVVAFLVVKVVGGRKSPVKPVATEVAKAAPEPAPAEPVAVAEPVPAPKASPAARSPEPRAKTAPAGPSKAALRAAKLAEKRERAAAKAAETRERAAAKVAEKRERAAAELAEKRERASQAKARRTKAPRARKIAMAKTTAKTSAPSAPVARADARPAYERGNAALLAGDGKAAIAAYREAVKSAPSDPIGFRGLGLAYEHEGETAAAIKALHRYLKLAPDAADQAIISRRLDRLSARQTKKK